MTAPTLSEQIAVKPDSAFNGFDNVLGGFSAKWLWPLYSVSILAPWSNFALRERVYVIPDGEGKGGWLVASSGVAVIAIRDESAWAVNADKVSGPVSIRLSEELGKSGMPRYSPDMYGEGDVWSELLPDRYQPDVFMFSPFGAYVSPRTDDESAGLCFACQTGWEPRNRTDRGGFRTYDNAKIGPEILSRVKLWSEAPASLHDGWPCNKNLTALQSIGDVFCKADDGADSVPGAPYQLRNPVSHLAPIKIGEGSGWMVRYHDAPCIGALMGIKAGDPQDALAALQALPTPPTQESTDD